MCYFQKIPYVKNAGNNGIKSGEKTAQAAQQYGMKTIVSEKATIDSLTQLLVDYADRLRLNRE